MTTSASAGLLERLGRTGLITKGILYCLLGTLAFMAAFGVNGQSVGETDRRGVFETIRGMPGGTVALAAVVLGLLCYCGWRALQAFGDSEGKGRSPKGWAARARYLASGLTYASVAFLGVRFLFAGGGSGKDSQQALAGNLLRQTWGQGLAMAVALVFFATGFYQFYYAFRNKYRKHAGAGGHVQGGKLLLLAGKIGYCARGAVWLLIGTLFARAALHARASEAGDTSKAFTELQQQNHGHWIFAAIAIGLLCYGLFNFIRARYDHVEGQAS